MAQGVQNVFQIKVSLNGSKPPIWRRLLISSATDLEELHTIIQIAMGWTDTHLHQYVAGPVRFREPDPDFDDDSIPEAGVCVSALLTKEKQWITYEYDFGDGWEHRVTLEKILPYSSDQRLPQCTGGRRGCPPEDVGGVWGYAEFLKVYRDEKHPEHRAMVEWAGPYFDPDGFDPAEVNQMLSGM